MKVVTLLLCCMFTSHIASSAFANETESAPVSKSDGYITHFYRHDNGTIDIWYNSYHSSVTPKEIDPNASPDSPVNTENLALAADGKTLGWLVDYKNCCTSYPIPKVLVLYKSGRTFQKFSSDMMIWNWRFYKDGQQLALLEGPPHGGGCHGDYKLYDIMTGKMLDEYNQVDKPLEKKCSRMGVDAWNSVTTKIHNA
jgi:hypothetical protein